MFSEEQVINVEFLPNDIVDGATYIIKQSNPNSYTHGMFKYPCKFIPEIPRWGIKKYSKKENTIVFDPFSGSGTTLLEANINGLNAYGTEIDDIAKLIIKVKTTRLDNNQINELDKIFEEIISIIYKEDAIAYIPLINNLEHWFQNDVIKQLGKMKNYIDSINDSEIRDFLNYVWFLLLREFLMLMMLHQNLMFQERLLKYLQLFKKNLLPFLIDTNKC